MLKHCQTVFHRAHEIAVVIYVGKFFSELFLGVHFI